MRKAEPKTSTPPRVIVVIHVEIMAPHGKPIFDEMVWHVAADWRSAETFIRQCKMVPFSWWKLQQFKVGSFVDDPPTRLYSHTGRRLNNPPHRFAMNQWEKWEQREQQ